MRQNKILLKCIRNDAGDMKSIFMDRKMNRYVIRPMQILLWIQCQELTTDPHTYSHLFLERRQEKQQQKQVSLPPNAHLNRNDIVDGHKNMVK